MDRSTNTLVMNFHPGPELGNGKVSTKEIQGGFSAAMLDCICAHAVLCLSRLQYTVCRLYFRDPVHANFFLRLLLLFILYIYIYIVICPRCPYCLGFCLRACWVRRRNDLPTILGCKSGAVHTLVTSGEAGPRGCGVHSAT